MGDGILIINENLFSAALWGRGRANQHTRWAVLALSARRSALSTDLPELGKLQL